MSYKHPAIPSEREMPNEIRTRLAPMRETLEVITGRRPGLQKIADLPEAATTAEIVAKINEILARLQA